MIKGIIFDLDGVIVHTDKFHYLAWKKLADKEGIYFDEKINNLLRGVSRSESLEIILRKTNRVYSSEEKSEMLTYKNDLYREYLSTMTKDDVALEVIETLNTLKSLGIKLAIGSSSKNARYILEKTRIIKMFDAISDGNNITKSKPDPEVFIKAREMLNLNPTDCIVVEDAYAGIDAANAGGFISVGIGDAQGYEKTNYPIHKFKELLNFINIK
jgi:beta-phosphoglucomutase